MPRSKFYDFKLGDLFFIKSTLCRKTSVITYVVTGSDEFIGELSYDPVIDAHIKTQEEFAAATIPKPVVPETAAESPVAPERKAKAKKKAKKAAPKKEKTKNR
jgi:hypothetical protein